MYVTTKRIYFNCVDSASIEWFLDGITHVADAKTADKIRKLITKRAEYNYVKINDLTHPELVAICEVCHITYQKSWHPDTLRRKIKEIF